MISPADLYLFAFPHKVIVHTIPTAAKAYNVLLVSSKTALN